MKLNIYKNPNDDKYFDLELFKGVTVLLGQNGAGKTTIIKSIEDICKDNEEIACYSTDVGEWDSKLEYNDLYNPYNMTHAFTSEGEQLYFSLSHEATKFGAFAKDNSNITKILCIDKLDSGLSYNLIIEIADFIKNAVSQDFEYIIITANSYELASQFKDSGNFYWVPDNKYIELETYDSFITRYKNVNR